jgi:hypothetical protein|nr:MAG TPA: Head fiber protein [Bacteriophage sp.]
MAYQIHPVAAAHAVVDPKQVITDMVFVDGNGNPVDVQTGVDGAPSVDSLVGATDTGKALLKAGDQGAARKAINAAPDSGITAAMLAAGVIPGTATQSAAGLVKQAAVTPAVTAADAAQAAGDTVTKAEFDAVVAVANETKRQLNALITSMRDAQQASSK